MGTRSTTTILDEEGKPLLRIYQQYDGYIEGGVGENLIRILEGRRVVQGYTREDKEYRNFNGMSCLAAQIVADLKDGLVMCIFKHLMRTMKLYDTPFLCFRTPHF